MKYSNFNNIIDIKDGKIIYNSLSGGVLKLNQIYANQLLDNPNVTGISEELFENLKKGCMIIEDDVSEIDRIILKERISRFSKDTLGITIAPTLKCNFACDYCYEAGCNYSSMDDSTTQATIDFIMGKIKNIKHIGITWYGGEPLLMMDTIERISKELINNKPDDVQYHSSIVTNGYNLNAECAMKLKELQVSKVQITIDGPPHIHDKRRKLHNGDGSFERIMNNICESSDIIPIVIRINVDKTNIEHLQELLTLFENYGIKNKVPFYIAPVDDVAAKCKNPSCFTCGEFSEKQIAFLKESTLRGFNVISIPQSTNYICGAVSMNSFLIDPLGDIYKCWDDIGRKDEKIGDIFNGISNNGNLEKWLLYDSFESKECKECSLLPSCLGGCPYYFFKTGKHKCIPAKNNCSQLLDLMNNYKK